MDMNGVTQLLNGAQSAAQSNQGNQATNSPTTAPVQVQATPTADLAAAVYTQGEQTTFQPDMARVSEMWNSHQQQVDSFRRMIETLLNQQASRQGLAQGWQISDIEITPEMRAEAEEMIGEGGYFSVEETAARILDFAVAISGGDPARIDLLERAVERGFQQAERMFGREMPQISHDTMQAVRDGFNQWREGGAGAIELLNRG